MKRKDIVTPLSLWNETSPAERRLPKTCAVLEIEHGAACQTGVLVTVQTLTGKRIKLSAAWFLEGRGARPASSTQDELWKEEQPDLFLQSEKGKA